MRLLSIICLVRWLYLNERIWANNHLIGQLPKVITSHDDFQSPMQAWHAGPEPCCQAPRPPADCLRELAVAVQINDACTLRTVSCERITRSCVLYREYVGLCMLHVPYDKWLHSSASLQMGSGRVLCLSKPVLKGSNNTSRPQKYVSASMSCSYL